MTHNRLLKILVGILLALNIGTLAFFYLNRPPHPEPPHVFFCRELQLTEAQQEAYAKLREAHRSRLSAIRPQMEQFHQQQFQQLANPQPDSLLLTQTTDSITALIRYQEQFTWQHFREIRNLCSPEQAIQFDRIIFEAWKKFQPKGPGKR